MKKSGTRLRLLRGTAFAALCLGAIGLPAGAALAQAAAPVQTGKGQTEPSQQQQMSKQQDQQQNKNGGAVSSSSQNTPPAGSGIQSSGNNQQSGNDQQSSQQNGGSQQSGSDQQSNNQQSGNQQSGNQQSGNQQSGNQQSGNGGNQSSAQQNQKTEGGLAQADQQQVSGKVKGEGRPVSVNVTVGNRMMMHAAHNPDNWLLYGRTYDNQRFSPLKQINTRTVSNLLPKAIIQTGVAATFEDSPMEVNGVLYIITANDHVQAYNAITGKILWSYDPKLNFSDLCCGPEARGVAVAYGRVYVAQLDARLVALNAYTGKVEWKTDPAKTLPQPTQYSFTMAPQVYKGMVIVGSAGAEYPTRGFVEAFDAKTGKVRWTFRTIAKPGEPGGNSWSGDSWKGGGGSVWNTPAVDPKNGLILFGVGNPNPDNWGESRKGDNAYTDSIVAIHANDGKIAWWYQEVKHDVWDYDAAGPVVLFNAKDHGKEVPAAAQAGKVGNVFIVNRLNGKLIRKSEPFVLQSANMWTVPGSKPIAIYPAANGGGMWSPSAYSPLTHYFYVMGDNEAWTYTAEAPPKPTPNVPQVGMRLGGLLKPVISEHPKGTIPPSGTFTAINVNNGRVAWQYKSPLPMQGGVLATAGNLVFTGEMNGDFDAFNAHTGQRLWHFNLGVGVNAPPITYRINGVQYIAVAAGGNGNNGNPELMKEIGRPQYGDTVAIFAVPQRANDEEAATRMERQVADNDDNDSANKDQRKASGQSAANGQVGAGQKVGTGGNQGSNDQGDSAMKHQGAAGGNKGVTNHIHGKAVGTGVGPSDSTPQESK